MNAFHVSALVLATLACVTDVRARRIPNALTFGGTCAALATHLATGGPGGLGGSVLGGLVGLALFLPFFALRGMGGGDVKLLAALGAWLGPSAALWLAVWTALAGAFMAVAVGLAYGCLRRTGANLARLVGWWCLAGLRPCPEISLDDGRGPRLPYALPIAAGLVVTLCLS